MGKAQSLLCFFPMKDLKMTGQCLVALGLFCSFRWICMCQPTVTERPGPAMLLCQFSGLATKPHSSSAMTWKSGSAFGVLVS